MPAPPADGAELERVVVPPADQDGGREQQPPSPPPPPPPPPPEAAPEAEACSSCDVAVVVVTQPGSAGPPLEPGAEASSPASEAAPGTTRKHHHRHHHHHQISLGAWIVKRISNLKIFQPKKDVDMEEFEIQPARYKPDRLDKLSKTTGFSKKEIQFVYRAFKQECPTGMISEETFKSIYAKFFPLGALPEPQIINGQPAARGQFPWQARVVAQPPEGETLCGGSLIHPEWVLTAAHCVLFKGALLPNVSVILGSLIRTEMEPTRIKMDVPSANIKWMDKLYNASTAAWDAALIKLPFPAPMPTRNTNPDSSQYAHYVFSTLDRDKSGTITFGDFMLGLSVLVKGSLQERLRWAFSLYDENNDGCITKEEMTTVVTAIYDLMGASHTDSGVLPEEASKDHVDRIFQKLDLNNDGVITIDEFIDYCSMNEDIRKSFTVFDDLW